MIKLVELIDAGAWDDVLVLSFDDRQKSRLRVEQNGQIYALMLPRGVVLRDGQCLRAEDGSVVRVRAAEQTLSQVHCADRLLLAKLAYHLGNRHVPVEIGETTIRYEYDPVLDDLARHMGLQPRIIKAAFEPESGAYLSHAH